ncbi:MAG: nucleotidyl transferase AbiEii/AbiGii toxin family protein [Thermoguttaceae bacterium]|nr:nucleotidyl transferase AbiEii/AbiGii toxin family protein [Thermoguttaceae bacterium]MBR5758828.1 nucleotidyl transferase AbiEii/AbiGii toxin family protein [Thermoguttaceae bacterium]
MADKAASVLARLKNKASENGKSFQLCVQLFCQEEFLRRLEKSNYVENLVLKGGLFIYSLTGFDSRVTVDVDFLLRKTSNSLERLNAILEDIIAVPTGNDFVTFEIKKVEPVSVAKKYAGVTTSLIARIKNVRIQFGIDFGVGDVVTPAHQKRTIPTQLPDFDAPTINAYSIESVIAEKVDAILCLMEFSSRMKDYYDVYYLANKFDFCGKTLSEALRRTFANRERCFTIEQFEQVARFSAVDEMRKKWNAFVRKTNVEDIDYGAVLKTIAVFLYNPLKAAVEDDVFTDRWVAAENQWKK